MLSHLQDRDISFRRVYRQFHYDAHYRDRVRTGTRHAREKHDNFVSSAKTHEHSGTDQIRVSCVESQSHKLRLSHNANLVCPPFWMYDSDPPAMRKHTRINRIYHKKEFALLVITTFLAKEFMRVTSLRRKCVFCDLRINFQDCWCNSGNI